jgi:hypothetical protein
MAHCSACKTTRLFRVNDGYPIIAKVAAVDEETQQERRERKLADERHTRTPFGHGAIRRWPELPLKPQMKLNALRNSMTCRSMILSAARYR